MIVDDNRVRAGPLKYGCTQAENVRRPARRLLFLNDAG
jgi:hypothetical protein